jgi:hypothetical protein
LPSNYVFFRELPAGFDIADETKMAHWLFDRGITEHWFDDDGRVYFKDQQDLLRAWLYPLVTL